MQSHPSDFIKILPGFWTGLIQLGITAQESNYIGSIPSIPVHLCCLPLLWRF